METFPKGYEYLNKRIFRIGMRRMLCFIALVYNICELFEKTGFIPILNNWFDDKSTMKTVVEDRRSSHRLDDYNVLIRLYTQEKVISVDRPNELGDRPDMRGPLSCIGHMGRGIRCLWFRSDAEWTCRRIVFDIVSCVIFIDLC